MNITCSLDFRQQWCGKATKQIHSWQCYMAFQSLSHSTLFLVITKFGGTANGMFFLFLFRSRELNTFSSNILEAGDDWHFNNEFKSLNAETSECQQQWDNRNFLVLIAKSEAEALIISSTAEWIAIFADDERREVFIKSLIRIIFNHERLMLMCDHFPHYVHMCSS